MKLSGWGKYPLIKATVHRPTRLEEIPAIIKKGQTIARGKGRAYGDSAINPHSTIDMTACNRLLAFNPKSGQLVAEAGVSLADIIAIFVPRGWFPPVVPGTKFVTLGGMVAADVHGKNHHKDGSFGRYVDWLDIVEADGKTIRCSRRKNAKLFDYTIGGMGLTGVITRVAIRLRSITSSSIKKQTITADNVSHTLSLFEKHHDSHYSVAWIDCLATGRALGRSVLFLGEHAGPDEWPAERRRTSLNMPLKNKLQVPFDLPSWTLNRLTVGLFNSLYFRRACKQPPESIVDLDSFFFPLDNILGWNKIYGRRGFLQFQCVLPIESCEAGLNALLSLISESGVSPFLAVLKKLGPEEGGISFPMDGYTLALDFSVTDRAMRLQRALEQHTLKHNGRFYLAKDAVIPADVFAQSDDRIKTFEKFRSDRGSDKQFASSQSKRLGL
jgi:decaprenylphospho-beta-D-ribofuranose 2-oxidase